MLRKLIFIFLCLLPLLSFAEKTPIENTAKSVYRVVLTKNVTSGLSDQLKNDIRNNKGIAEVPSKDNKKSYTVYEYKNEFYVQYGHGSSFAISKRLLVTNHHVIEKLITEKEYAAFVVKSNGLPLELSEFKVKWFDAKKDLALIEVSDLDASPLQLSSADLHQNESVTSIGFPGSSDAIGGANDIVGFFTPRTRTGSYSSPTLKFGRKYLEHSAPVSGGNSGGPLVNQCGEVIGVNTFVSINDNNVLFALSVHEVMSALKAEGIDFIETTTECKVEPLMPQWLQGALIAIALIVIGIIAFIIHLTNQMKQGINPYPNNELSKKLSQYVNSKSKERSENKVHWKVDDHGRKYRYDSVAGLKYEKEVDQAVQSPEKSVASVNLIVANHSISQKSLLKGGRLIIGADNQADLQVTNEAVSSKHLAVSASESGVFVEDLNSTNGSYLNGTKIIGSINVTQSSIVYLVDKNLNIQVEIILDGKAPNQPFASSKPKAQQELILKSVGTIPLPSIHLPVGQRLSIGRSDNSDITIDALGVEVGRQHCFITATDQNKLIVEDKSTNGTYVDSLENRINKSEVSKGQVIYLATEDYAYQVA